jgi:hypothetical protein
MRMMRDAKVEMQQYMMKLAITSQNFGLRLELNL